VPKEVGVYMYYFPLMAVSTAVFDVKEKAYRYFFIVLPFLLLIVLLVTDFKLFGDVAFYKAPGSRFSFVINIISSGVIVIMCIDFMRRLNETSESRLQQLAVEIKGKNDDLEKTNTELDRFLYSTSHDLRSPLASIKGLISVARYDTADKKIHGYFDMVIDRVNRLEHFIKDIIDYSKNSRTEVRHEPIDFNALLNEVVESLRYVDNAGSIQFRNDVKVDHTISADKGRLSVVLTNLMANAIKYHDLRKECPWIQVKVSNSGGTVKLRVSDNGTGISEEHQGKIFEMFYRGTAQSNGSGLGLYIVKQAVEKMQGTIKVQSAVGQGTEFSIEVPVS
jgi:signal transduction histidine kinase